MAAKASHPAAEIAAAEAAAVVTAESEERDLVTLSRGITLRIVPVPPFAIREAAMRIPVPSVPIVHIKDKNRDELNPNDPDYLAAVEANASERMLAATNVMFVLGTKPEIIPAGCQRPDDTEWTEALVALGIEIPENKHLRYLSWLRYYVLVSEVDIRDLVAACISRSGVQESEVQRAIVAFRGREER